MKVECIKKIVDLNKIYWAINCFRAEHRGKDPSYIVMNYETKAELISEYYFETVIRNSSDSLETDDCLFGIPVAYSRGLKLGEVDIV